MQGTIHLLRVMEDGKQKALMSDTVGCHGCLNIVT